MDLPVLAKDGKKKGSVTVSDTVFGREPNIDTIYFAIRNELANRRVGTADVKERSEVRGSKRKPWRQKGTGRARAGTRRSPIWVGGGTVFGPSPRDYSYSMPRKQKRAAYMSLLSLKLQEDSLKVVSDFAIESGKTKEMAAHLAGYVAPESTVLVLDSDDAMTKRAARNIPWLKYLSYNRLSAHDLFYAKNVLVTESGIKKLDEFFGGGDAGAGKAAFGAKSAAGKSASAKNAPAKAKAAASAGKEES
jgi:large subunit ribosomal protein L4